MTSPTHTLDLVITREQSNQLWGSLVVFISGVSDTNSSSSLDHYAVLCYLNVNRTKTIHKTVKFRAFRNIPLPDYRNNVKLLLNNQSKTPENINDLLDYCHRHCHWYMLLLLLLPQLLQLKLKLQLSRSLPLILPRH